MTAAALCRLPAFRRWTLWIVRLSSRLAVAFFAICGVLLRAAARVSQPAETWTQIWPNAVPFWLPGELFASGVAGRRP